MSEPQQDSQKGGLKAQQKSWWPTGIVVGLGVVVVANAVMLTFALSNPSIRVSEDPYADSLRFDAVLAERQASRELGWDVALHLCPEGVSASGCQSAIEVRDREGRPIRGLSGEIRAEWGNDRALDRSAQFVEDGSRGEGHYLADIALSRPGVYEVSVRLQDGPRTWVASYTERVGGAGS